MPPRSICIASGIITGSCNTTLHQVLILSIPWVHVVHKQNNLGVHLGNALVIVMCLTARWSQIADEEDAVTRPWASVTCSRRTGFNDLSFSDCKPVPSSPLTLTSRNIADRRKPVDAASIVGGHCHSAGEVLLGALRLLNKTSHEPIDHESEVPAHDH